MKPHVRKIPAHPVFPGEFICSELGSRIYGNGTSIPLAIAAWKRRQEVLQGWGPSSLGVRVDFSPPPTTEPERTYRRRSWQTLWLALLVACALAALGLYSQQAAAIELQKCEWLADEAYGQTWLRDAGVTFTQLRIQIRQGDAPPEVKQGQIALSKYVYAHPEMSPDQLADDVSRECRSYDE